MTIGEAPDDLLAGASFVGDAPVAADGDVLSDRRELALVALERTRMPMVITDPHKPDNPIVLANQAFMDLCGYAADEVIGRNCRFLQGPNTDAAAVALLRDRLKTCEDQVEAELLNYRKDGTSFWNQLLISAVRDKNGALLYYFASQKDISARRRAEALEHTERKLLMEVDHRAINALTLVQGIVRLSRSDNVEDYSAAVLRRVDSLARAHRLLADKGWTEVNLSEVIALEAPARIEANGPSALLKPALVQPVALVVHELVANAKQHGGLSDPGGTVTIGWEERGDTLVLNWAEIATNPPLPMPRRGMGLTLIEGVIERQLRGRMELRWPPEGLTAILSFPRSGD